MKKLWLVVMGLALLVFGCFAPPVKDCGTDKQCMDDAIKTCTSAKGTSTESGMTTLGEVRGSEGNNCIIWAKISESPMPILKDKEMTCKIPKDQLSSGSMSNTLGSQNMFTMCSGSLVDLMKSLGVGATGPAG